jgi:hypothetical protein
MTPLLICVASDYTVVVVTFLERASDVVIMALVALHDGVERREGLGVCGARAVGAGVLLAVELAPRMNGPAGRAVVPDDGAMRLLVLGGTHHVGRAVVEAALARGDTVTTLTRG